MPLQHRLQPGQIEQDENARSFSPFPLRILQHRGPCKLAGGGRVPGAAPPREGVAALLLAAGLAVLSKGGGASRAGLAVALAAVVAVNAHDLVDWRVGLARYNAMAPASSSPSQKTPLICSSHTSSCTQPYLLSLYFLSPPSLRLCQSAAYRRHALLLILPQYCIQSPTQPVELVPGTTCHNQQASQHRFFNGVRN